MLVAISIVSPDCAVISIDVDENEKTPYVATCTSGNPPATAAESESCRPIEEVTTHCHDVDRADSSSVRNDIGTIVKEGKTAAEIGQAVDLLDVARKNALIFEHDAAPVELPSRHSHGCQRKFNVAWLTKYSWLRYSTALDGVFCGPCAVMLSAEKRAGKGKLVNSSFSNWLNLSDALSSH